MIYLDESRSSEALDVGWIAHQDRFSGLDIARTVYDEHFKDWQVIAVCSGPDVIGALYAKDGVIHLGIVPEWRNKWASKRVIRSMLAYGTKTTILDSEPECISFAARLGFVKEGETYVNRR